jgi:hypothetical protein
MAFGEDEKCYMFYVGQGKDKIMGKGTTHIDWHSDTRGLISALA